MSVYSFLRTQTMIVHNKNKLLKMDFFSFGPIHLRCWISIELYCDHSTVRGACCHGRPPAKSIFQTTSTENLKSEN